MTETRIVSFVIRFIQEPVLAQSTVPAGWRGVIRHVQSRDEVRFMRVEEALTFMERFVSLEQGASCTFEANGLRLHYLNYPGGEALPFIFLPGLTANAHMVDGLIAAGLNQQRPVFSLDWRGRGQSDKPESGYSMGEHAADVIALMDTLGIERAIIGGHSFGGLVGFYLAACYPERVERLVIFDSSPQLVSERTRALVQGILDRLGQRVPSLEAYLEAVRQAPYLKGAWDEALERYYRSDVEMFADGTVQALARPEAIAQTIEMEFAEPWDDYLRAIRQPVLLLNALAPFGPGGAPPILPLEMAQQTADSLTDCRYREVPGNHITMLFGANARQVVEMIEDLVNREASTSKAMATGVSKDDESI